MQLDADDLDRGTLRVGSTRSGPVGVGVIGAGMISDTYLEHLTRFPDVSVLIVGARNTARAQSQALKYSVPASGDVDAVLTHPGVELAINLTIPAVHASISSAALAAGKHVWSEKPLATDRAEGRALLDQARAAGLLIAVAPDTVLGPGLQTAQRAIADGVIGTPIAAQTTIQYPGPDLFHPSPEFLFAAGAGPLFDVGPYYLTALVQLLGPVTRVATVAAPRRETRTVRVGERTGTDFPVTVATHVSAVLEFSAGAAGQSIFSFESPLARMGVVEITGTEGTMLVPDPNTFDGPVRVTHGATTLDELLAEPVWKTLEVNGFDAGRGIGALDLARCIRGGGMPRAGGELAYHVLDTMLSIEESIHQRRSVEVSSTVAEIPLLPAGWDPYQSTLAGGTSTAPVTHDDGPPQWRHLRPGQRCQIWIAGPDLPTPELLLETSEVLIEAPNWSTDNALYVNGNGTLWRIRPDDSAPALEAIDFTGLPAINNDHVLSPDGTAMFMSAMDGHIYRGSLTGGEVERVTHDENVWHFLHGVAPDGSRLAYVRMRRIDEPGRLAVMQPHGESSVLETGPGHLDGPEWSPDGRWIYLNTEDFTSSPGHAQLARIPDGGGQLERLTASATVDWFPHLSPDGGHATYLAFPPGTIGHPADLPVEVRVVATKDWTTPLHTYPVMGGQGTINVNSWDPTGRRFAFVAYPLS
ncbi:MAG: Gfo/Idh/MocA family oxidoreductase [Actinomycetales bacterium]